MSRTILILLISAVGTSAGEAAVWKVDKRGLRTPAWSVSKQTCETESDVAAVYSENAPDVSVTEGSSVTIPIQIELIEACVTGDLTLRYEVRPDSASAGDFTATPAQVTLPLAPDSATIGFSTSIEVFATPDSESEGVETADVLLGGGDLFNVTDGTFSSISAGAPFAQVSIEDAGEPPMVQPDVAQALTGIETLIDVLANDTDPAGGILTISSVTQPANGTVEIRGPLVAYRSADDFTGTDTFTYTATNNAGFSASASVTVTVGGDQSTLDDVLDEPGVNPVAQASTEAFTNRCALANLSEEQLARCNTVFAAANAGSTGTVEQALVAIAGEEISGIAASTVDVSTAQTGNVASRIEALRAGTSGLSLSGLNLNIDGQAVAGDFLQYLLAQDEDSVDLDALGERWGVFLNGSIGGGDQEQTSTGESAFDFDTYSITGGVDYRFRSDLVAGLAVGFSSFSSDYALNSGSLDTDSISVLGYGSYYATDQWHIDASLGYSWMDLEQVRVVDLSFIDLGTNRLDGDTDGNEFQFSIGGGYDAFWNAWRFSPQARFEYADIEIDGFTEQGPAIDALIYPDQDLESIRGVLELQISRAFSLSRGVLQPYVRTNMTYEGSNDGFVLLTRLAAIPNDPNLTTPITIDDPDRFFGNVDVGTVLTLAEGRSAYLSYQRLLGFENLSRWSVRAGIRIPF